MREQTLYEQAKALVLFNGYATVSLVQRHLLLGYAKAAAIVSDLEANGVVGRADRTGRREILP